MAGSEIFHDDKEKREYELVKKYDVGFPDPVGRQAENVDAAVIRHVPLQLIVLPRLMMASRHPFYVLYNRPSEKLAGHFGGRKWKKKEERARKKKSKVDMRLRKTKQKWL